jgi:hypothetical protein
LSFLVLNLRVKRLFLSQIFLTKSLHHAKPARQQRDARDKGEFNVLSYGAVMRNTALALTLILILLISGLLASVPSLKADTEPPKLQWSKTYGPYRGIAAVQTIDGGYALAGFDVDERKEVAWTAWVVKIDAQGNVQWSFHFEQPVSELLRGAEFRSITQTVDGGYVAVGYPALVKLDPSGRLLWNVTTYNAYSVSQTEDGGFIVTGGQGNPRLSDQRIWLAKFAQESGNPSPTNEAPPPFWATVLIAVIVVAVFAAGLGLLIYLIKRKD